MILNVSMIRWPAKDKLAEPPTYQQYLFCFSLSLAKSSKDNEESQERSVRSASWKNERLLGLCQQQQVNTEATDVLWAPSTHVPHRFKITHVAGDFKWCDACEVSAYRVLVTASLSFCYFSCHLNHKGGFHILSGWSSLPVNVIVHAGLRGYFPGVQIWESMSLIHSLPLLPFLAQSLPGSLLAPKFLRLRCGPCSMRRRARWNMPFWELLLFQSHFRCSKLQ